MSKHDEARELVFYKNPDERRRLEKYISDMESMEKELNDLKSKLKGTISVKLPEFLSEVTR
jgi:hypothetical protein